MTVTARFSRSMANGTWQERSSIATKFKRYFLRKFAPPKITRYTVSIDLKRSYLNEISFEVCYLHTLYGLDIKDAKLENRLIPDGRGFCHTHNYKDKYVHAYMHCTCLVVIE